MKCRFHCADTDSTDTCQSLHLSDKKKQICKYFTNHCGWGTSHSLNFSYHMWFLCSLGSSCRWNLCHQCCYSLPYHTSFSDTVFLHSVWVQFVDMDFALHKQTRRSLVFSPSDKTTPTLLILTKVEFQVGNLSDMAQHDFFKSVFMLNWFFFNCLGIASYGLCLQKKTKKNNTTVLSSVSSGTGAGVSICWWAGQGTCAIVLTRVWCTTQLWNKIGKHYLRSLKYCKTTCYFSVWTQTELQHCECERNSHRIWLCAACSNSVSAQKQQRRNFNFDRHGVTITEYLASTTTHWSVENPPCHFQIDSSQAKRTIFCHLTNSVIEKLADIRVEVRILFITHWCHHPGSKRNCAHHWGLILIRPARAQCTMCLGILWQLSLLGAHRWPPLGSGM